MKKIKFRGKLNSNGKWIYGMPSHDLQYIFNEDNLDSPDNFAINSKTICEFAGLTDKNDNEYYEADIITCLSKKFKIQWVGAGFCVMTMDGIYCTILCEDNCKSYEIIGNLFENPELQTK
jgi:hypothetical protein